VGDTASLGTVGCQRDQEGEHECGGHHGGFWECSLFSLVDLILSKKISCLEQPFDNLIEEDLVFSISRTTIIVDQIVVLR
jgi:hypothetical protein